MSTKVMQEGGEAHSRRRRATEYRFLGRRIDRLEARLALGTILLVVTPLAIGFRAFSRRHYEVTIEVQKKAAELQGRILEAALRHEMMTRDRELMTIIFREIGLKPAVRNAMLLDHRGEVRVASRPDLVGTRISQDQPECQVCHAKRPEERERWTLLHRGEEEYLRAVLPIPNRTECHACHDPEARMNGILILDTSLVGLHKELRRDALWFIAGTVLLALIIMAGSRFLIGRLVLHRLGRLGNTARAISSGDIRRRAFVGGDDGITALAEDFNNMADTVLNLLAEVRQQEAQLTSIMNSLDDGLVVFDVELRTVAANLSFCRRLGTHPGILRGRRCHELSGVSLPCCEAKEDCPARLCLETATTQRAVFQRQPAGEDELKVEEVHASPVFDDEGKVIQVVEIWRDISARVKEEQRLAEIEQLVSLGTLASGFSHQVNTPLGTMLACAESLLARIGGEGGAPPAETTLAAVREHAETIRQQVLRCKRMTEQFLRFSRGIPPGNEPIDLCKVVRGVVDLAEPTARQTRVTVVVREAPSLPPVQANVEVVQHVLLNLLINAIQSCEGRPGRVQVSFLVGEDVRVLVEDDGCGVSEEARRRLFQPFRSHKAGGTGLGLFLARSFMRRFQGDVRLRWSRPGQGSCFEVVFHTT